MVGVFEHCLRDSLGEMKFSRFLSLLRIVANALAIGYATAANNLIGSHWSDMYPDVPVPWDTIASTSPANATGATTRLLRDIFVIVVIFSAVHIASVIVNGWDFEAFHHRSAQYANGPQVAGRVLGKIWSQGQTILFLIISAIAHSIGCVTLGLAVTLPTLIATQPTKGAFTFDEKHTLFQYTNVVVGSAAALVFFDIAQYSLIRGWSLYALEKLMTKGREERVGSSPPQMEMAYYDRDTMYTAVNH
jgi:hypothetical protein